MKRILLLPNPMKPMALGLVGRLAGSLADNGFEPVIGDEIAGKSDRPAATKDALLTGVDLVMVLGGDGSMLNAARRIYPREIPLLGVNLGHLGFLTRVESDKIDEACRELRNGNYSFENRTMIEAEAPLPDAEPHRLVGLNELVLTNPSTRLIRLETWIDDEYFTTYPADGLIVATATGSTAYSLSAGGPIMDPRLRAIIITPICAHSLYARPLVLSKDARIRIVLNAECAPVSLTADGQDMLSLESGTAVVFRRAPSVTRLLRFNNQGLFKVLRSRLKEGRI